MALKRIAQIKADLLSCGVRLPSESLLAGGGRVRKGGAGPADGVTLVLEGSPASVPIGSAHAKASPYHLEEDGESASRWVLCRSAERLDVRVSVLTDPRFYEARTADGIPYRKIALLHGSDCLASTVLQSCAFWGTDAGCRFCGIGLSLMQGRTVLRKNPHHLAEVAAAARTEGIRHVTLTAGTTKDREEEWVLSLEAARAVRDASGLPVHAQLMPPLSRDRMKGLRDAGVSTLGIHVESLDPHVLQAISPCKASVPFGEYLQAWKDAVEVFGRNQVSTFVLLGLGEDLATLGGGYRRIAEMGVYPYLVPFRPIPGTPLADRKPLEAALAREIYEEAAGVLADCGLRWSGVQAGCVRCRGCSALPDFEDALAEDRAGAGPGVGLVWEVIESGPWLDACFAIRHEVFVREQGFFPRTDRDDLDPVSIHILARGGRESLGTVRITPLGDGRWLGSRLAVLAAHRGSVGHRIVRKAEEEVWKRGGKRFFAYIQLPRVEFFQRCGWRCLEEIPDYHGRPHMLMEAPGAAASTSPGLPWLEERP